MKAEIRKIKTENNDFQHLAVLKRNREKRKRYGKFFVEGVKPVERAVANNWPVIALAYSSQRRLSSWARGIMEEAKARIHYDLSLELMEKLSDKEESSELIAVVSMPPNDLERIEITGAHTRRDLLLVVFDRPSSHGNLGAVIRSCDAFRAAGLIITGHCVDVYAPETIRAGMGSFFSLPVIKSDPAELLPWLSRIKERHGDLRVVGTSAGAERIIDREDLTGPVVLFLGNETRGLSRNYREFCDCLVKIPIQGGGTRAHATSLNVACAASVCLYEIDRQRRRVYARAKSQGPERPPRGSL